MGFPENPESLASVKASVGHVAPFQHAGSLIADLCDRIEKYICRHDEDCHHMGKAQCSVCLKWLCKNHVEIVDGTAYCAEHLPVVCECCSDVVSKENIREYRGQQLCLTCEDGVREFDAHAKLDFNTGIWA